MLILDKEIHRVVSSTRNVVIARNMFQSDLVEEVSVEYNNDNQTYIIKGKVGTHYTNQCTIVVDDRNNIINYECNCHFCDEKSGCAHVGATLFKLQDISPDTFPCHFQSNRHKQMEMRKLEMEAFYKEKEMQKKSAFINERKEVTKQFIESAMESYDSMFETATYSKQHLHCQLSQFDNHLGLRFKIGNSSPYVIKSIPNFLQRFQKNEKHKYGKNLTFVHDVNNLYSQELEIFHFMKEAQITTNYRHIDEKFILINENNIDDMFEAFYNMRPKYFDFRLKRQNYKPILTITKEDNHYIVECDAIDFIYGKLAAYAFKNQVLCQMKFDNAGKVASLLKEIQHDDMVIAKEDMNNFYRFVLQNIEEYVVIEGKEFLEISTYEVERKLYGDSDEFGSIHFTIECNLEDGTKIDEFDINNTSLSPLVQRAIVFMQSYEGVISEDYKHIYFDANNESTYSFIHEGLPVLGQYFEVYVSEVLQKIGQKHTVSMSVGISIKNDLLHVDLESLDIPKDEILDVLHAYKRKRKFHKLKDGQLVFLHSDELDHVTKMIESYDMELNQINNDGSFELPKYRAFSLDNDVGQYLGIDFEKSSEFESLLNNIKNVKIDSTIDAHFDDILRDYQKEGVAWLQTLQGYQFGGILADDMGLGKTLQVIAMLESKKMSVSIVVAPASLLLNWQDEIHKFAPAMKCCVIHGTRFEREELISNAKNYDVIITSYDYIRRDVDMYKNIEFHYIVLDEAQYIKNQKTKNAISVKQLHGKYRLALTGTPIENSLAELWSIFDFLMSGYLFSYRYFQQNYEYPIVKEKDDESQVKLKNLITPFVLRRTKKEVLKELPDKIENTITVPFNEEEKKVYFANLAQVSSELQQQLDIDKVNKIEILAMLTKLRQICCEPRIVYEEFKEKSSKMQACLDIIENYKENNKKILVFSSFTTVLGLLEEELKEKGIKYFVLTGSVDKVKRRQLVHEFQNDDTTVFLISLKAGGTGLNLTAAEGVIHFDPWWNMSVQNQATDRVHRIGQKNVVQVFKLIMEDSIEQKIAELQQQKKDLADAFVEGNEGSLASMSTNDLLELFTSEE